jgi:hypothetical protein
LTGVIESFKNQVQSLKTELEQACQVRCPLFDQQSSVWDLLFGSGWLAIQGAVIGLLYKAQ